MGFGIASHGFMVGYAVGHIGDKVVANCDVHSDWGKYTASKGEIGVITERSGDAPKECYWVQFETHEVRVQRYEIEPFSDIG